MNSGKLTADQAKQLEAQMTDMQNEIQRLDQDLAAYKQQVQQQLVATQQQLFKPVKEKITKEFFYRDTKKPNRKLKQFRLD